MNQPGPIEEFTVCFPNPTGDPAEPTELRVRGTVDQVAKTITFELPNGARTTLDVVTARALQMILWEGVFGSLHPSGPRLRVERSRGDDGSVTLSLQSAV
jgi:hypothetical protein